ncbi:MULTISPECIES: sugar phosphate nucleotidyltransferase [unclassified Paenibacillus]|uniref:sugar phosphate nucleotidyltransferase n=1 Tax=unclassified Paenibacillus TaxID=185978 RepID=UPI002406BC4E|nr:MULTISPECIES: sugar phosphate nucleotidyltransferase [unclassified Paenibacillus]MDF9842397.1 mannose-1-phosphate guanylyltransferase [Paenibacillus sp. PastF-2]MDF9848987.1 mannose-1-phosphate guanylyltransferase [Paenibacillus sp. PastM-2]MDF9855557.1 mannose-1-phosphate guanylyltransferase [Paenibacillus sp. PastF-1]MDH6480829.1 mannose-1-phosphate guanylyltransferase [Paenibacillus sp. PastH-2]MDH6508251.1 mannose-1-phosphate guanylyltransferase [Paenibacillus sp. PastM-3]
MKLVLLSGGSGKRLWPLSNDSRSKQFLKVLESPAGEPESMVQRVWRQLEEAGMTGSSYLATGRSQVESIQSQLGSHVPIIVEPERRDTFPAIALTAAYLYSIAGVSPSETVAILPVDPYVEASFFDTVVQLEQTMEESGANLALMGVVPEHASEKYGYIIPTSDAAGASGYLQVSHFQEKPDRVQAEGLISKGALWNCGVFAFRLGYLLDILQSKGLPINYEELQKQYKLMASISFDYEVVEKEEKIVVQPYAGFWKDLGTWNTLTEEMSSNLVGKGVVTSDSEGTCLINELDIPITVIGAKDLIIAASPDGILVTHKAESPRIKEVLKSHEQRPMYEERRWGHYKVIDYVKYDEGNEVLTKRIFIEKGKNISYQLHHKRSEIWTFVSGEASIVINEKMHKVKAGDVVRIPEGTKHAILALTDVEFIEVQSGSELVEEDNIRITLDWEDIELHQFIS